MVRNTISMAYQLKMLKKLITIMIVMVNAGSQCSQVIITMIYFCLYNRESLILSHNLMVLAQVTVTQMTLKPLSLA